MTPQLVGLDWGTTSCRAYLLGPNGSIFLRDSNGPGILRVENGAFDRAFDAMSLHWFAKFGPMPVVLSGMIGSRQGWLEVSYARCPASTQDLVGGLATMEFSGINLTFVPGLSTDSHGMPDVMRGEETQIFGALALSGRDGLYLLPGTHSKWAEVADGRITSFRTFMTGEVFAALKGHTILGRLMRDAPADEDGMADEEGFALGVREGAELGSAGSLLNRLFATRTYGLTNRLPDTALAFYLSGLLIGAEIAEAIRHASGDVTIVASPDLAAFYQRALAILGRRGELAPDDCVAAGHWRIAALAGLVKE